MKTVRIFVLLMMCIIMTGCGSTSGQSDDTGTSTPTTPAKTYNLTGIVYGESGTPMPGVTIYVFSDPQTTTTSNPSTDSSGNIDPGGKFYLNVSSANQDHTLMGSRSGSREIFQIFNLSSAGGSISNQPLLLYNSLTSAVNAVSNSGKAAEITSNKIGDLSAKLTIPAQTALTLGGQSVNSADITLEYLDLSKPSPVPLPSPSNSKEYIGSGGKQSPSAMVAVQSARLGFGTSATLTLPNPGKLTVPILRFDHEEHKWIKMNTSYASDGLSASAQITKGGIYGIFFTERKTATIRGTAPANSAVFAGDEIITVKGDGTFTATVAIPSTENLDVVNVANTSSDANNPSYKTTSKNVSLKADEVSSVDFTVITDVTISSITLSSKYTSLVADDSDFVEITAELTASDATVPDNTSVTFSTNLGRLFNDANSTGSDKIIVSTSGGLATIKLKSVSGGTGTATITASSGSVSEKLTISILPSPGSLTLSLTKADGTPGISVKSDGSDYIDVTATVLDINHAPIPNIYVTFKVGGGQIIAVDADGNPAVGDDGNPLDPTHMKTGNNGKTSIRFSAGVAEKANRTVNITATVGSSSNGKSQTVPVQITGSTISLTTDRSNLSIDSECKDKALMTVTLKDAGSAPIFDTKVTAAVTSGNSDSVSLMTSGGGVYPAEGVATDLSGEVKIYVCGKTGGTTTVKVEALKDPNSSASLSAEQIFTITDKNETFGIIEPDKTALNGFPKTWPITTGSSDSALTVKVRAPKASKVRFSTTFGYWNNQAGLKVTDVSVAPDGMASALLRSGDAGLATVQVFGYTAEEAAGSKQPSFSDGIQVAFYAPSSEANKLSLQASSSVVGISSASVVNSVTLTATVKSRNDQVVKDVPVAFSLTNTTGGGEYVSPVLVYTNELGIAETKFYSGTLSSRAGEGIAITAVAQTGDKPSATTNITIGGTPTSIIISRASTITSNDTTTYSLDMSVTVVDSKGNPVPKVKVTLGVWPSRYETGIWRQDSPCGPVVFGDGPFVNEDVNRNLISDTGEDKRPNGGDGKLTPPASASGSVSTGIVETSDNGVGTFQLVYPKNSAAWIEDEVTATTVVLGSETKSVYTFWLPYSTGDECTLFNSPYNDTNLPSGKISMQADPSVLLSNGSSTSTITATFVDFSGSPVSDIVVSFTASGGGFPDLSATTATTDSKGVATVTYRPAQKAGGTATITARSDNVNFKNTSGSVTVRFGTGTLEMNASPASIAANGTAISTVSVTAIDPLGLLVSTAEPIRFTITSGGGSLNRVIQSTSGGLATATYTAGSTAGTVTIKAEMVNTGVSATTNITLTGQSVGFITLGAAPTTIKADGVTSSKITATITDSAGNAVSSGTPVEFHTTAGKFQNGSDTYSLTTSNTSGTVVVSLIAGYTASEEVVVTCTSSGITQSVKLVFESTGSGDPTAAPAYIQSASGYPNPSTINVRGTSGNVASKVAFVVYDTNGDPVANEVRVDFQILSGPGGGELLLTPFDYTDSNGEVSTILRSGLKSGPVLIKASCFQDRTIAATSGQIIIGGGPVVGEGFSIAANYINVAGLTYLGLEDTITVSLSDAYGNAASDNTMVSFKTYNTGGYFSTPGAATTNGKATGTLVTSSPTPARGFVSVTAETLNGGQTTHVTSLAVVRETEYNRILYAGTNGGGVYKSTDSGLTWKTVSRSTSVAGQNWIDPYVNDVVVDPFNRNIVYAATGYLGKGNIYRSLDGGQNWNSNDPYLWNGIFSTSAAVLTLLCDDDPDAADTPWFWAGTDGSGLYAFQWDSEGTIPNQKYWERAKFFYVNDIVKVIGTHGSSAILYAGTSTGVYKSSDGGKTWENKNASPFIGYHVNKLAIHPGSTGNENDVIYAATKDGGVWVSINSGKSWIQYVEGIGKGVFATYPKLSSLSLGNGTMSEVTVYSGAKSETWSATYTGGTFKVVGGISGTQSQLCTVGQKYTISNVLAFTINAASGDGAIAFQEGDMFTFDTLRDDGRHIKDLLIDAKNNRLYAVTYFNSDVASHATGSVYVHDLNNRGEMAYTDWREVGTGLSQYDPPTDTSLFANYVLASDDPSNLSPTALYLGGEGINFYRTISGVDTGIPIWQESKSGLSNILMARIPILFSDDDCKMDVQPQGDGSFLVYVQDINGNPPVGTSKFTAAAGSVTYWDITYPDAYAYQGTCWKTLDNTSCSIEWDGTCRAWNCPYYIPPITTTGTTIKFTFSPLTCPSTTAPGCSGSAQSETYSF